jgi:hypothetical protein
MTAKVFTSQLTFSTTETYLSRKPQSLNSRVGPNDHTGSVTSASAVLSFSDPAEFDLMANDPGRVLVRQMFGAIAQYDKGMIVAKLKAARMRKKVEEGRCEGQRPYRYARGSDCSLNPHLFVGNRVRFGSRTI